MALSYVLGRLGAEGPSIKNRTQVLVKLRPHFIALVIVHNRDIRLSVMFSPEGK